MSVSVLTKAIAFIFCFWVLGSYGAATTQTYTDEATFLALVSTIGQDLGSFVDNTIPEYSTTSNGWTWETSDYDTDGVGGTDQSDISSCTGTNVGNDPTQKFIYDAQDNPIRVMENTNNNEYLTLSFSTPPTALGLYVFDGDCNPDLDFLHPTGYAPSIGSATIVITFSDGSSQTYTHTQTAGFMPYWGITSDVSITKFSMLATEYWQMARVTVGSYSGVGSDPIINGLDGTIFDFKGQPDRVFNILSLPDFQVSSLFIAAGNGTYTGMVGVRQGKNTAVVFDLHGAYMVVDGERKFISFPLSAPISLPNGGKLTRSKDSRLELDWPHYSIHFKRIFEHTEFGQIDYVDFALTLRIANLKPDAIHGVLGQTYFHNRTADYEGTWKDYAAADGVVDVLTNNFPTNNKFFKYNPNAKVAYESSIDAVQHAASHRNVANNNKPQKH